MSLTLSFYRGTSIVGDSVFDKYTVLVTSYILFYAPNSKMLEGHIAFGFFVYQFIAHSCEQDSLITI